jgi:hypothetical protein
MCRRNLQLFMPSPRSAPMYVVTRWLPIMRNHCCVFEGHHHIQYHRILDSCLSMVWPT